MRVQGERFVFLCIALPLCMWGFSLAFHHDARHEEAHSKAGKAPNRGIFNDSGEPITPGGIGTNKSTHCRRVSRPLLRSALGLDEGGLVQGSVAVFLGFDERDFDAPYVWLQLSAAGASKKIFVEESAPRLAGLKERSKLMQNARFIQGDRRDAKKLVDKILKEAGSGAIRYIHIDASIFDVELVDSILLRNVRPYCVVIHHSNPWDNAVALAISELEDKSHFVTCWQNTTAYLFNSQKYEDVQVMRSKNSAGSRLSIDSLISQANRKGAIRGLEINPESGILTASILRAWTGCREYHLVGDYSNQAKFVALNKTIAGVRKSVSLKLCKQGVTACATSLLDNYFDVVMYVEPSSRKNIIPTLAAYWPKIKAGGVLIGMDISNIRQGNIRISYPSAPKESSGAKASKPVYNSGGLESDTPTAAQLAANFFSEKGTDHARNVAMISASSVINVWYVVK